MTAPPETAGSLEDGYLLTRNAQPGPHYPKVNAYRWQEFAGLAVEMGGYSDLTLIDPYTGDRLWVGTGLDGEPVLGRSGEEPRRFTDALRKALDVADHVGFPGRPE